MRDIKFRGKRIDGAKEWLYGSYILEPNDTHWIDHYPEGVRHTAQIDPKTIGQFTGMLDSNGKEIYEGDIVKTVFNHKDTRSENVATVEHDSINPCFVMTYRYQGTGHLCHEYDFVSCGLRTNTIIGNIHDHES